MDVIPKEKPVVLTAENYAKKNIFKFSFVNPKILGMLTVILIMVIGVGGGVYLTQSPQKTVSQAALPISDISFRPLTTESQTGKSFNVDVFGNANNNQITGVTLAFKYDPEFLELTGITPKQFLPKVLIAPEISSGSASVSLGTEGNAGISGSGILATLSFTSKKETPSTKISFDSAKTQINVLGTTSNPLAPFQDAVISIKKSAVLAPPKPSSPSAAPLKSILPSNSPVSTSSSKAAGSSKFDFNSDGQINSIDLAFIYSSWGTADTELKKKADLNLDGLVNGLDYALFIQESGKQ